MDVRCGIFLQFANSINAIVKGSRNMLYCFRPYAFTIILRIKVSHEDITM